MPEDFISGNERPVRRNPLITSILYYSKDVESFGTGLKRISDACDEAGCRFEFKILKSGFVVVFYREENASDVGTPTDTPTDTPTHTPQDTVQDTVQDTIQDTIQETNQIQAKILAMCEEPRTREELMAACGLKNRAHFTSTYLKPMLQAGQIKMTIPDKPRSKNQRYIKA